MQRVYPSLPYKLPLPEKPGNQNGLTLLSLPTELLQAVIDEMVSAFGIYQAVKLRLISSNYFLQYQILRDKSLTSQTEWFNDLLLDVISKGPYIKLAVLEPRKKRMIPPSFLAAFLITRYEKFYQFKGSLMNIICRSVQRLEDDDGVLLNHSVRAKRIAALCHAVSRNLHREEIIRLGDTSDAFYLDWDSRDENYGALIAAVSTGDVASTRDWLKEIKPTSTRAADCFGTALVAAASNGQYSTILLVLKYGANVNDFEKTYPYRTALGEACSAGHSSIAKLLLDQTYKFHRSYHHCQNAVESAISAHHWDLAQYLIEASGLQYTTSLKNRLFFQAAIAGNVTLLSSMLDAGADINQTPPSHLQIYNHSVLGCAALKGQFEVVKLLLSRGIDKTSYQFNNALVGAAQQGDISIATILLDSGADINHLVTGNGYHALVDTPVSAASRMRRVRMVRFLLSRGADPKAGGKGDSSLLLACKTGAFSIARMLVEAGVDPNGYQSRRSRRSVPILTALKRGHYQVADLLLILGARSISPNFQEAL